MSCVFSSMFLKCVSIFFVLWFLLDFVCYVFNFCWINIFCCRCIDVIWCCLLWFYGFRFLFLVYVNLLCSPSVYHLVSALWRVWCPVVLIFPHIGVSILFPVVFFADCDFVYPVLSLILITPVQLCFVPIVLLLAVSLCF